MTPEEPLHDLARRQVRAVLRRWDPTSSLTPSSASVDDLVTPVLAAVTFEPQLSDLAEQLRMLVLTRLRTQVSRAECLAAARDLLDDHRRLFDVVIDAA